MLRILTDSPLRSHVERLLHYLTDGQLQATGKSVSESAFLASLAPACVVRTQTGLE